MSKSTNLKIQRGIIITIQKKQYLTEVNKKVIPKPQKYLYFNLSVHMRCTRGVYCTSTGVLGQILLPPRVREVHDIVCQR